MMNISFKTIMRIGFGILMMVAGSAHFVIPAFYVRLMPPVLPYPEALVAISGIAEIVMGVLLMVPHTSRLAAWGLVALLVAVYPANIYMAINADSFRDVAPNFLFHVIRLPLQFVLIGLCVWFGLPQRTGESVPS